MTFSKKKKILTVVLAVLLSIVLTFVLYESVQRARRTLRDRVILLAYQTNINGSDGEMWASYIEENRPDLPGFEVSVYTLLAAGNDTITITSSDGWAQIATRLRAGQGDILFLNNKTFYETMLAGGYLSPLEGSFANAVTDERGVTYGLDITGMTAEGLLNLNTSTLVGKGQPLPIVSTDEAPYRHVENEIEARVIACVFRGAAHAQEASELLYEWFGVASHA